MLTDESLPEELQKLIRNVAHGASAQGLEVLCDVLIRENSENKEFGKVKEEKTCYLEELNGYKMDK